MKHTIICGFPGVGKTSLAYRYPEKVVDSDSSVFSNDPEFQCLLEDNWESWINILKTRKQGAIQLKPGEYLADVVPGMGVTP